MLYELTDEQITLVLRGLNWLKNYYSTRALADASAIAKGAGETRDSIEAQQVDKTVIGVRMGIEQARTLAGFGDCCCDLTPGAEQGTCVWCVTHDELYRVTGEECYNRKGGV